MRLFYIILIIITLFPSCIRRKTNPKGELRKLIKENPELLISSDTTITYDPINIQPITIDYVLQPCVDSAEVSEVIVPISNPVEKKKVEANLYVYLEKHKPPDISIKNGDLSISTYKSPEGKTILKATKSGGVGVQKTKTITNTLQDTKRFWEFKEFWRLIMLIILLCIGLFFSLKIFFKK